MKCKQAEELMGAYLYGDLAPEEMHSLRMHAQDCTLCREDLATRGRVISALSDATPELSDADRQRISWSVKGALGKPKVAPRPLVFRLAPALGLALTVLAVGFVVGRMASRSPHHGMSAQSGGHAVPEAKIEVKETTPKVDPATQLLSQGVGIVGGFVPQTGTITEPNRSTSTGRSGTAGKRIAVPQRNDGVKMAPDTLRQPPATNNSAVAPKESEPNSKKTETGTDSGETKLPRVSDPKNAETTPSDSQ